MSSSSKAKPYILCSPSTPEAKHQFNMWRPDFPDWYYYNAMLTNSSGQFASTVHPRQHRHQQQQQQQDQQGYRPSYSYMPRQQSLPYGAQHERLNYNGLNRAQAATQAQAQAQAQQQAWLAYQKQQLKQQHSYSYWYGLNQQLAGRTYRHTDPLKQQQSQGQTQPTINLLDRSSQSGSSQHSPYPNQTSLPGSSQNHDIYSQLSSSGSLNRIDSVSSFKNQHGLHIRDSQHDMNTYQLIAARKLKTAASTANHTGQTEEEAKQIEEALIKQKQPIVGTKQQESQSMQPANLVIKCCRGNSLLKKLGLIKHHKTKSTDLKISNSNNTQECTPSGSRKSRKSNFFKRIFRVMHYPSTKVTNAAIAQDLREELEFDKVRHKH
ncbi:transcription factor kayak-like [Drosophila hydei]|uniref:Transcription factor kayak-like n=1 Tax=Drosophila hydei TaxID=7224 RepID=A0A6J1L8F4_DROHY|nr:transcription factor kayak-like [Drosophila hydei]